MIRIPPTSIHHKFILQDTNLMKLITSRMCCGLHLHDTLDQEALHGMILLEGVEIVGMTIVLEVELVADKDKLSSHCMVRFLPSTFYLHDFLSIVYFIIIDIIFLPNILINNLGGGFQFLLSIGFGLHYHHHLIF